jgi:hypothetical protein
MLGSPHAYDQERSHRRSPARLDRPDRRHVARRARPSGDRRRRRRGFGFAIGHLLAVLLGIHDQYADRMARVLTAACAAIALAYWIMYVITGWKGP